ncbi:MAG: hypothetical protein KGJ61_10545, partial [Candidatus Omnitrophica bacterium]|nr:hypothetical protein [Candidatus Omnitrophota bacterium]
MTELSTEAQASASNRLQSGLQAVARALSSAPLPTLSKAVARDDSTVCRIRSEEVKVSLSDAVRLLYAAGMKVVLADRVCVDKATYEAMSTIAAKA